MKRFSKIAIACVTTFLVASCGKKAPSIEGDMTNSPGGWVYLEELLPNTTILLDSTAMDANGHFELNTRVSEMGFYLLRFGKDAHTSGRVLTLLTDSMENIELTGDLNDLQRTYKVEGSTGSGEISELTDFATQQMHALDSLSQIFQSAQNTPDFPSIKAGLEAEYQRMKEDLRQHSISFIQTHDGSLSTIIALYQRIGRDMVFDASSEGDLKYFEQVATSLDKTYPNSKHVQTLKLRIDNIKAEIAEAKARHEMEAKLAPGLDAPEITLNDPSGKPISLSSLRGKVVLIDFWASWCRPCRAENPNVVRVYKEYHKRGFEIYAVSLDRSQDAWVKAIEDDNLTWIHVSDLAFWSSPILQVYGITSIPSTVLIGKDGKIIARNLRGESLEQKLKEVLG
ncbi:MAG: AhpC/TSA family protein [Flavobacteriales bacterium]|nr:AhpC/TSA family protein [Flavobacteriales bacterium]MCB9447186.1 AhpC/TSA family protein [Flavobacteriales bacterium]